MASMPSLTALAHAPGSSEAPVLASLRAEALEALEAGLDWPSPKASAWRNTRLSHLGQHAWQPAPSPPAPWPEAVTAAVAALPQDHHALVLVDGVPAWDLCKLPLAETGAYVADLWEGLSARPQLLPHLDSLGLRAKDALAALSLARVHHGALVHVGQEVVLPAPLHILYLTTGQAPQTLTQPRVLVVAESRAQAQVFEHHVGLGQAPAWTNAATDLWLGDNAQLDHMVLQQEAPGTQHLGTVVAHVGANARLNLVTCDTGSALGRRSLDVVLGAAGAEARLCSVALGRREQHLDTQSKVRHLAPHTRCVQAYRAILDDHSVGVFNGLIEIAQGAQQISADQMSRGLVLSQGAQAILKPQMLISADDVKCTHGATIGQLDEDALFYLLSRGIERPEAQKLLAFAFLAEAAETAPEALRTPLLDTLCAWLGMDRAVAQPLTD